MFASILVLSVSHRSASRSFPVFASFASIRLYFTRLHTTRFASLTTVRLRRLISSLVSRRFALSGRPASSNLISVAALMASIV